MNGTAVADLMVQNTIVVIIANCCAIYRMQSNVAKSTDDINEGTGIPRPLPAPWAPPDGGWGWMCVVGCALMHFLVVGYTRSYGLIYMRLRSRYDSSAALTAWVGGACIALRLGCSERILLPYTVCAFILVLHRW